MRTHEPSKPQLLELRFRVLLSEDDANVLFHRDASGLIGGNLSVGTAFAST